MSAVLRTQLGALARRPTRLLLTGLALIVASFVVYGVVLAQACTERTVLDQFSGTPAAADLVVRGANGAPLPAGALPGIRATAGVAESFARIARVEYLPGGMDFARLSTDPGTGPLSTLRLVAGAYPAAAGEVAATRKALDRLHLRVGSTITLVITVRDGGGDADTADHTGTGATSRSPVALTITGVVEGPHDSLRELYTTDAAALALPGDSPINQIEVGLDPGTDPAQARAAITAAVTAAGGAAPTIRTGAQTREAEMRAAVSDVDAIFAIAGMFVAIAVVAAVLVATSTFRIVFAQRMRQLALLRAVGAGRWGISAALIAEGMLTGGVAGLVGVAAAAAAGAGAPALAGAFGQRISPPGMPAGWAVAVVVGTALVATIAVLAPAVAASRVSPLEALRSSATDSARRGIGAVRATVGVLLVIGAAAVAGMVAANAPARGSGVEGLLLGVVASGTLAYLALVTLGPVLLAPVLAMVGWPMRRLGAVCRLAVDGVGAAGRRAAAVSVVVALGGTLIAGVLIGAASIRSSIERELAAIAPADFQVAVATASEGTTGAPIRPQVVDEVRQHPQVRHVLPYREVNVDSDRVGTGLTATDVDLRALPTADRLGPVDGSLERLGPGRVVLWSGLTEQRIGYPTLAVGDRLTLRRGGRSVEVAVAALLPALPMWSHLVVDPADLDRLGVPAGWSGLYADATVPGSHGRTAALDALRTVLAGQEGALVNVLADQRAQTDRDLAVLVAIALGLIALTVLVAVVGVGTTTALSVVERVREAGLLRAVGMSRRGLRGMLTLEASLYGVIGAVLGLALAVPYSWLALATISDRLPVRYPVWQLAAVLVTLALCTALAGVLPARSAARVTPVVALGDEA